MMDLNEYQKEQWTALNQIKECVDARGPIGSELVDEIRSYLEFREGLDSFSDRHFRNHCSRACFKNQVSACCSKDGIVTFWADHVINASASGIGCIDDLLAAIRAPQHSDKCIYLGTNGCLWRIRPLGCALFLCDGVQKEVLDARPSVKEAWDEYRNRARGFRWPDRPVLFDRLEQAFMAVGCRSPLMYINTSPGLRRVKQKAGIA